MTRRLAATAVAVTLLVAGCTSGDDDDPATEGEQPTDTPPPEPTVEPSWPELGDDAALAAFYAQQLDWAPCGTFDCATLEVPLDYADPDGATIELAVLRVPTESDERVGSLVVNPGGPGGSGVEYASLALVSNAVGDRFDIVGFDPRGVANSTPVSCLTDAELNEFVAAGAAPAEDAEEAELAALAEQAGTMATGCELRSAELLPHLGTPNVARDMDVLRVVLGDDRLYYLGKSYGTYIGAWYAELFGDRVGRMVLDGAIDPSLSGHELSLGQASGFDFALTQFLSYCVERGECPLGTTDVEAYATVRELVRLLADAPLTTFDEARPLTQSLAILGIAYPLYLDPASGYDPLIDALQAALADNGDDLLIFADLYLRRNPDGSFAGNQNEAIYAVNCLDRPSAATVADVEASLPAFRRASEVFGEYLAWGALTCAEWPAVAADEPRPLTAPAAPPILVVGTTGDPATPYAWAEALADQLSSGVLLTFDDFGHTAYFNGNACVDEVVDTYLLDGELPDDEAALTCS